MGVLTQVESLSRSALWSLYRCWFAGSVRACWLSDGPAPQFPCVLRVVICPHETSLLAPPPLAPLFLPPASGSRGCSLRSVILRRIASPRLASRIIAGAPERFPFSISGGMDAPPRKRGRPPKHPKVQATDSPTNHHPLHSPAADVEMVDRVPVPPLNPVDSRPGQRGRKKSVAEKADAHASGPGAGGGSSPSDRELKSEADDVDSPVERLSSRRHKKSALVSLNASLFLINFASF